MSTSQQQQILAADNEGGLARNWASFALTPTQTKVLEGVNSGRLNKQIAGDLGIAEATVKAHMTALMRKLKVQNRTQAAIMIRGLN